MSLITQCPTCTTLFKVVRDQLRISEGWVRCGQCDAVFDANAHLQSVDSVQTLAVGLDEAVPHGETSSQNPPSDLALPEVPALIESLHTPDPDATVVSQEFAPEGDGERVTPLKASAPSRLSFMEKSTQRATRGGALSVVFWCLSLFLLVASLCLQVVVQERDRLAALEPGLSPMLESLCEVLDCKVSPLRQIESVVIESSSFVNVQGSVYRLSATLKNSAPIAVAVPAMELTLTDLQDQAVIRRVIPVSEFGPIPHALSAGAELQTTFPLNVKLSTGLEKFSGYRLVIFYP